MPLLEELIVPESLDEHDFFVKSLALFFEGWDRQLAFQKVFNHLVSSVALAQKQELIACGDCPLDFSELSVCQSLAEQELLPDELFFVHQELEHQPLQNSLDLRLVRDNSVQHP